MNSYTAQSLTKGNVHSKSAFYSKQSPRNQDSKPTDPNSFSKEEFFKEYFAHSAGRTPKTVLPPINRNSNPSYKASASRFATEPPMHLGEQTHTERPGDLVKNYFLRKYYPKTTRTTNVTQDSLDSTEAGGSLQTVTTPPKGNQDGLDRDYSQLGMKPGVGEKYSVLKGLEEVYAKDFKKVNGSSQMKILNISNSPYGKNHEKASKPKLAVLGRVSGKNLIEDNVLMGRFENPYAENLPYNRPVNASVYDKKSLKLKELEIKSEVLRNVKQVEEDMMQVFSFETPKGEKSPVVSANRSINGHRELVKPSDLGKDTIQGQAQRRKNLFMYSSNLKK